MADIRWDDAELEWLTHSLDGPVGRFLAEKSAEAAAIAVSLAPVQKTRNWSWGKNSSSYMPRSLGYLKGSVTPHMGYTRSGMLFGGVNAAYGPALWMERPADQMHSVHPFLSTALYAAVISLVMGVHTCLAS
jgi:hypothetical protein